MITAACILPNTFDYYKPKALKVMPSDVAPIFTDDFVNTVLGSDAVRYFWKNDRSLFKDYDAIATKALIAGYVRTMTQSDDNVRRFIPDDIRKGLNIELANLQITPKSVASYIDKVKKSIVSEPIVSDGGNVEVKQDLTLADYGVETANGAQDLLTKWRVWLKSNPHGIVAYRTDRNKFSDPKYALETRSMGNPFMGWLKDGQKGRDTELFRNWLLTGENAGNSLATEELRQAYLQLINDAAKNNAKVLYYTNIPPSQSHASVIGDLIRNPKQIEAIATNAELQQDLGGGEEAKQEIKDAVSVAIKGISFEKALEGQESFFTKEEQEKIKQSLDGKKLQVMSVSRLTDPAFFAKEIVSFLEQNAKKDLSDPTRVQAIEIWSKHDGLPIKSILDACKKYRVAPMVSFSITGLGGTSLEGGVMKYKDMLQKVGELVKNGTLNPTTTTVRIDPILVGVTSMDDIKDIVKTAKSFGIKKFVTSLVQSYGYTEGTPKDRKVISGINNALAEEGKTYDWDKYYGRDRNGKINFKPKKEYVDEVSKVLLELDKDPEITIQTCAFGINGLKVSACLDPMIIERIVGTSVINPDGTYDRDTSRPECMCYGCHSDFFKGKNKKCYSSCAYCYAAHSGDNKLNYYNEDGTLKDNDFTRTEQTQPTVAKNATTKTDSPKTISSSKLSNTVLYSNYSASDGLFNNATVDSIDDMLKNGSEVIVLFTNTQLERDETIAKAMSYNKGKAKKDWCILRINPSDDEIKTVIANHNKIGIFRGNNSTERNIDNLYKNVTITTSKAEIDNADFMENHDLILFSHKVQHLYTQNRLQHLDAEREQIMRWVLQDIQKEYDDMSDADKDTYKGIMLKKLADNYEHVTSLITVTEQVDTDSLEDYDYEDGEDVLWSEQHNTSNMPKDDILASVLASFQTGKEDELGTPLYYDSMVINNILTRTISGSKDSNDMIGRLKSAQRYNKWMDKLIENINSDTTGRLKSILFTKYANLYAAKYVTINGNRIIDESSDFATTSINVGVVSEMDEKRSPFSKEITDKTCENIADGLKFGGDLRKLPYGHPYREQYKQYLDDNNSRLVFYLAQAGIELNPDEHDINALTDDELTTIRQNLAMIYQLRARDGWMETENFIANCKSSYSKILAVLNKYSNQKTESTVRTAGESKFVYADKNYIDTIFDGLDEDYKAFMQKEFLDYGEFTSDHSGDYEKMSMQLYSSLLRDLALSTKKPEWFRIAHFFVNKENGKNPAKYSDLTKDDLAEINRKMFWKEQGITKQGDRQYVWVHAPIYADKGQLHFYRVPIVELEAQNLDNDNPDTQMPQILKEIVNLIKFETNRISNCKKRSLLIKDGKIKPIDVYDTVWKFNEKTGKLEPKIGNGERYCFQPMLNEYGVDENGKPVSLYDILAAEDSKLQRENIMRQAAANIIANIIRQDCKQEIKGTDTEKDVAEGLNNQVDKWAERIEETLNGSFEDYNKVLNEIRRFDYSQSKEKRDRQKQWEEDNDIENDENTTSAQIGERMIERIQRALTSYVRQADILQLTISDPAMYKGEVDVQKRYAQVQAGYSRPDIKSKYAKRFMSTLYLKDNEIDLESVDPVTFNIMRATLERASKVANIDLNVKEIMKSFKKVNVADAQCYRTLSSYRAVRDMFGQWTAKDDALFEKIRNGEQLTADDYMQVWQTLKPFVYTQQPSEWTDADGVEHKTKVGYQYKNSENVLFNMYLLFNGGKKTVLGELNRFMEQYKIDTAQFESAVKVGREGLIDLNNIDAEDVFEYLEKQTGVKDQTTKLKYTDIDENGNEVEKEEELPGNPHVIHRIPYKEYGIKTSTPPHMFDVEQQLGSQLKKLLQGDIPDNAKIYLDTDGLFGNESESPSGKGNRTILVNGEVITLSANKEIQPDGTEKTRWSLNKQDYLKLYNGLLNDLILSEYGNVQDIFKDRERLSQALQEMMGTSPKYDYDIKQALKVKDGKFIVDPKNPAIRDKVVLLLSSILKNRINKQLTKGGTAIQMACWKRQPPLNIVRNPDGTIKYMECLMPAYSKQWVEAMMNKDGVLDPKKCKDENLLKALCYRVPTEDIYSMIPLKIVGFTPLQFGTNIMLPQEITTLTGSDFDVDKMYLFLPEFELKDKWNIDPKVARERFEKSLVSKTADYEADVEIKTTNKRRSENEEPELTDEEKEKIRKRIKKDYFNAYCVEQKYKVQEPRYVQFDSKKDISDNSKAQKCNLLLALMRGAISSPHNITKEQNPGGFDYLKELAEEINPEVNKPMNLTESQYLNFFNLNMTGKRLIGIYANHNVAHSLCQDSGLGLAKSIKIGDNEYNSLSGIYSTDKRRISRNIAEFLAASVDNAKDPVLAKLWQNNYTASTTCFLMRLGVPPKTILKMYKMLKDKCPEDFNKFMERGPAAFRKYADKYNADLKLGTNVKFQDGNKNVNTYNFFAMLGYYEKTIQNLETLNSLLKSDSTNGAMYDVTSIIENILKVKKLKQDQNLVNVDKLIPDFENDKELLNKSKSEILKDIEQKVGKGKAKSYQVAYYLTLANFRQYFNEIIDDKMINECINLGMQLPNFSADDIKHFIADYTKQQLRYLDMFAPRVESMKKNRKQLMELGLDEASKYRVITTSEIIKNTLEEIPKKLEEYKRKYKDNAFIQMLSRVQQKDGVFLMIKNIADMRAETVNEVKEAFNQLYSNDSSFGDAMDLIRYTLCVNGFGYDPRSFVSMIPIKTLAQVKGIENVFEFFEIDKLDNFEDNFIIKNDLVDYSVKIPSKHDNVFFMPTKSKIIGKMKIKDFKSTIINLIVNLNLKEKQITQLTKEFERDLKKDFKVDEKLFDEYEDFEGNANNNFLGRISSLINNNKEIIKIFDEETDDYKIAIEDLKKLYRIKYTIENHNGAFYKKMYETNDGAYYVSMEEKEQPDTHDKIYEVFDKEIVSNWLGAVTDEEGNFEYDANDELEVDEDVRKNSLKAIVDDVMKEAALQGLDTKTVTKEDLVKILNSENALGRYFNLDADPMSVYEPIAIEFC